MKILYVFLCLSISFVITSCSSNTGKVLESGNRPAWIDNSPSNAGYIYGVGVGTIGANPTFAIREAEEDARQQINKTISGKLKNFYERVVKDNQQFFDNSQVSSQSKKIEEVATSYSENFLSGIEITDKYEDADRGYVWALARMSTDQIKNSINNFIDNNPNNIIQNDKKLELKAAMMKEFETFDWRKK